MKMSQQRYDEIKSGIKNVIAYAESEKPMADAIRAKLAQAATFSGMAKVWELYHLAWFDFRNQEHPAYAAGRPRINDYKPGWEMYADGLNDDHYTTALRRIATELGLPTDSKKK